MPIRRAEILDWSLLALLTLAVYSTLGYARTIFDLISAAHLADAFKAGLVVFFIATGAAMLGWMVLAAKIRRLADYLSLAGLAATYLVVMLTLSEMPIERVHLLEYGAIGMAAHRALRRRFTGSDRALLATLIALNIGLGDELIQGFLPRRFYDTKDVLINAVAGLLGVLAASIVTRARKKAA